MRDLVLHVLHAGCRLWIALCLIAAGVAGAAPAEQPFEPDRLEKQKIVAQCHDPLQLELLADGRLVFIERGGAVRMVCDATQESAPVITVGQIPVAVYGEVGLLGLAVDKSFGDTGWLYLFFCPQSQPDTLRLSRFTIRDDDLNLESEIRLLEYPIDSAGAIHMGGGLWLDDRGDLWVGTGDNCPPIPELPVDIRTGRENFDALRTSANSQDLRGKILRIHPEPDGTYTIPAGNLFADAAQGRPEIFAMGCRNPFRLTVDTGTRAILWGDVGPNIDTTLGLGPNGYDEFHRATQPGNFGWPMFVGPNEAYRNFDFSARRPGAWFDPQQPLNASPNNTGLRQLPAPQPAIIWYPSTFSDRFPTLGSGGRSAMAGPVYQHSVTNPSGPHLHARFRNRWFIFDWTRNWIQTVQFDTDGTVTEIEPFMPATSFRKPVDMKVGPDGSLYVIEYGDKWGDNVDSEISRILYRRGNRQPAAELTASRVAGRAPLLVQFDASNSVDPDGDPLSFDWELNGQPLENRAASVALTLAQRGMHRVRVTVNDPDQASSSREMRIHVGNEPPQVAIRSPQHGSFFDWGETLHYAVEVDDAEDGSTVDGQIPSARVRTSLEILTRRGPAAARDPGLALMRKTTCFSCHTTQAASAGPTYEAVAEKYRGAGVEVLRRLAAKIIAGGSGVWSDKPMPPHPQHTLAEAMQMVSWVLSLGSDTRSAPRPGTHGFFPVHAPLGAEPSAIEILAEYTDNGLSLQEHTVADQPSNSVSPLSAEIPALRGHDHIVLHARKKRAAFADRAAGATNVDVFEGGVGLVARLSPQGWIAMDDLRLEEIERVTVWFHHHGAPGGRLVLRENAADGRELAALDLAVESSEPTDHFRAASLALAPTAGLTHLFLVYEPAGYDQQASATTEASELSLSWIEFHDSPATQQRKRAAQAAIKRVLLIPTQLDHDWGTHMYRDVCEMLATTLNLTPGVEALVCPDLDWPKDESLLRDLDAIVYYSRPAGDILLSPRYRDQAESLLKKGVGFTAIHWSTGAEQAIGADYEAILGGWFNFEFSGLKVDQQPLQQVAVDHPICRGWEGFLWRDEFYLNLRFHPDAIPLLKVQVDGRDQTVAWVHHRQDGGRSFGTTLGHFHENFADPRFRRLLVQGILWTAGSEIPVAGLPVEIPEHWLELEPAPATQSSHEWTFDRLRSALAPLQGTPVSSPSFENGKHLFQKASCAACHSMAAEPRRDAVGGQPAPKSRIGPDLTSIRIQMAETDNPRAALLRAIVEPSEKIDDRYRSELLQLDDGSIVAGLIKGEEAGNLLVADHPLEPERIRKVALNDIVARRKSDVSWMPAGLLDPFDESQIFDLLCYLEAGGSPDYFLYRQPATTREGWADTDLPGFGNLRLWLDAGRLNEGRAALGLPPVSEGGRIGIWPDASGRRTAARQRRLESQPRFRATPQGNWIEFDGVDDCLIATPAELTTLGFTAMMVVAPDHNRGWPGLLSGNAWGGDDFRTGFNLDLMPEPTDSWRTIMSEGPGYPGVINLMNEDHPWGEFLIVTLRSQPGAEGVVLRINGRPQGSRDRPQESIRIDELTVGSRYWSHDPPRPAHNRGFLSGRVAQVLFYDRPLADEELVALEVYLWNRNERLLDQR